MLLASHDPANAQTRRYLMANTLFIWWYALCAFAALNIFTWWLSAVTLRRRRPIMSDKSYAASRIQLLLSAVYVFGCAFRSVVPVFDVPRLSLFDTWLSSVLVGRSVATVAELCFVAQWALLLRESARVTGSLTAKVASRSVVPMIAIAEVCSWYSVVTTANLGHVIEESLWGFTGTVLVISMLGIWPRCPPSWRPALIAGCIAAAGYVAYMFFVDVPRYWSRWIADQARGREYLSFIDGLLDISARSQVSRHWEVWQSEVMWMGLYFSVAVWISISLVHAAERALAAGTTRRCLHSPQG